MGVPTSPFRWCRARDVAAPGPPTWNAASASKGEGPRRAPRAPQDQPRALHVQAGVEWPRRAAPLGLFCWAGPLALELPGRMGCMDS